MAKNEIIRAGRNRTLTVSEEETPALKKMITLPDELSAKSSFVDLLIHADALAVLDTIPDGCADLIIIDPPLQPEQDLPFVEIQSHVRCGVRGLFADLVQKSM